MKGRTQSAAALLRWAGLLPATALLVVMFGLQGIYLINDVQEQQAAIAQRMADLLAASAAESSAQHDFQLFRVQVEQAVGTEPVHQVRFVALKPERAQASQSNQISTQQISRFSSVELPIMTRSGPAKVLIGYVVVDIDLMPRLMGVSSFLQQQLVILLLLLLVLWLGLGIWARQVTQPLKRLTWIADQIRQGHAVVASIEKQQSRVQELMTLGRDLDVLSTQTQDLRQQLRTAAQDVERLTQREKLARSSRDDFQSMITHELKTPLNAIWGGVQLLRAEPLTATQSDTVRMIAKGSQNLSKLLDQILAMLGLEQGRIVLHLESFDPAQMLSQLAEEFQRLASAKQLRMEVEISHGHQLLEADVSKIRQILSLLLDNAIKFTEQGHVRLHSWIEPDEGERLLWCCDVQDSGIGIAADLQDEIFKPFFQIDSAQTRRYEGAGMGLALAQRLSQIMNGQIVVSSTPNEGSRFCLRVSVMPWQQNAPDQQLVARRVIVFETGLAGELSRMLASIGLNVHRIQSVEHAVQLCREDHIDALVICMHVSDSMAKDLVKQVRDIEHQHVIVIQTIERDSASNREAGHALGIDHWLRWPRPRADIVEDLARWMG